MTMFYVNDLGSEKSYEGFATREQARTWAALRRRPYTVTNYPAFENVREMYAFRDKDQQQ